VSYFLLGIFSSFFVIFRPFLNFYQPFRTIIILAPYYYYPLLFPSLFYFPYSVRYHFISILPATTIKLCRYLARSIFMITTSTFPIPPATTSFYQHISRYYFIAVPVPIPRYRYFVCQHLQHHAVTLYPIHPILLAIALKHHINHYIMSNIISCHPYFPSLMPSHILYSYSSRTKL